MIWFHVWPLSMCDKRFLQESRNAKNAKCTIAIFRKKSCYSNKNAIIHLWEKYGRKLKNSRKARNVRNTRIFHNFAFKKARNCENFPLFLIFCHFTWFLTFFAFIVLCENFSRFAKKARNVIWKKREMQKMWEIMWYEKTYFWWLITCEKYARNVRKLRILIMK